MRARAIVAILGAILVAVLAWYFGRDRSSTAPAPAAAPARTAPPTVAPRAPAPTSSAVAQPADETADPTPVLDSTHAAVHAIGRRCWEARTPRETPPNQPDDTVGRMELRIVVEIAGGTAHVRETEVETTRRLTDELRDCIATGVTGASWPSGGADGTYTITELFRMGDYTVPSRDAPPPLPPPAR